MATDKYPKHKALNPFFDVVMNGLNGFVDGEHYYDAIAEDAQFEFLYRFPGWAEVIQGAREFDCRLLGLRRQHRP